MTLFVPLLGYRFVRPLRYYIVRPLHQFLGYGVRKLSIAYYDIGIEVIDMVYTMP